MKRTALLRALPPLAAAVLAAGCGVAIRRAEPPPPLEPDPATLPPARFVEKPVARAEAGGVRVSFAADRAADVAVSVEDRDGRVVRHLVAGVLGPAPPPPLAPGSLRQSVLWDGTDDRGRKLPPGDYRVRVALGLRPSFSKMIGDNPADIGGVRGLAPAPDGKLYVFHSHGANHPLDGTTSVCVFGREGRYLRTVMPYPATTPDEKLAGLRTVRHSTGRSPFIYQFETRSFIPGLGDLPTQRPVVTRDGRLAFAGILEGPRYTANPDQTRLVVIHTDGGVPAEGVLGTLISRATVTGASLALSPDEETLYAAGLRPAFSAVKPVGPEPRGYDYPRNWTWSKPSHAVYRFGWRDPRAQVFVGHPRRAGDAPDRLDTPLSVATDAAGNVYVADFGNDRVAVFDPRGDPLGRFPVASPQRVEVSRSTGAVYVLCELKKRRQHVLELAKFDGYRTGREVARVEVYRSRRGSIPIRRRTIALDESAEPTVVWFGGPLTRVEDLGERFSDPLVLHEQPWHGRHNISTVMDMSMHRDRGLLYVNNRWRYHTRTGEWEEFFTPGGRMWPWVSPGSANGAAGRDGRYYVDLAARQPRILRFDEDMNPSPFPTAHLNANRPWMEKTDGCIHTFARNRGRGLTADRDGNVYAVLKKCGDQSVPGDYHRANAVYVFSPEGEMLRRRLVDAQIPNINHPRVDAAGNVYLAVGLRPGDAVLPPGLEGRVPAARRDPGSVNSVNAYPLIYGSVVKFGPAGGSIRVDAGGRRCNYAYGRAIQVSGAEWIFPGCSVAGSWATPKKRDRLMINVCMCESPCIDVDGFGRCFFPDAGRSRAGVVDTAGNLVTWFGGYGNPDSKGLAPGAGGPPGEPAIPLCWPQALAVDDRFAYVGDRVNRRIVEVRLGYDADQRCPVSLPAAK
jgi:sugar lactone lactonase YvrE